MDSGDQAINAGLKILLRLTTLINAESVKARFLVTLAVNIIKIGFSFISGILIARALGPLEYGNFNFLLGSFSSFIVLFDLGTSNAFYTFLSKKKQSVQFYVFYFVWLTAQFFLISMIIFLLFSINWQTKIWIDQSWSHILLAFIASFLMTKVWSTITQAGESIRSTVLVQLSNVALAIVYLIIIIVLASLNFLNVVNLFFALCAIYLIFSFVLAKRLQNHLIINQPTELGQVFNEFRIYCTPLIMYSIFSFLYSFTDVWLLQKFSGAVQQGYYSIGLRVSSVCFIATASISKIFWKEVAEASEHGNKARLQYLYGKISKTLCFIGAVGTCFLIPFSREILVTLLGAAYEDGWLPLAIMFLYPIHQSLGQINGTFFYATAKTKLFTIIGTTMMAVSIPVTYFILAPASGIVPGLGLASTGLAIKMVLLQIISVNICIYFVSRGLSTKPEFLYQFKIIILLLAVAFTIKKTVGAFGELINFTNFFVIGAVSLLVYLCLVAFIMYLFPQITGVDRKYLVKSFNLARMVIGRK